MSEPTGVYGSPRNTNHERRCGCRIKFRQPVRTTQEDTGYDIYNCPAHEAGPKLVEALEAIVHVEDNGPFPNQIGDIARAALEAVGSRNGEAKA